MLDNAVHSIKLQLYSDWSPVTAEVEAFAALAAPPTLDNGLINGTNTYNNSDTIVSSHFETTFKSDTRYRIRLMNTTADTHFKFSIDSHTIKVIAADFVPIVPYISDTIAISMGQRYDIIVTANAAVDNYWMRAVAQTVCSENVNADDIYGIIRYNSTSTDDLTSVRWANALTDELCEDELRGSLVPYVPIVASNSPAEEDEFSVITNKTNGVIWQMGTYSFLNQWDYPTLLQSYEGDDTWAAEQAVYQLPEAWIMHCHIAWHTSEGLAVQILERESELVDLLDGDLLNAKCAAWDSYALADNVIQPDSGT
ncbi:uncharacterized protein EAE98_007501 [Botrytis deweyae]|uniref:Plastocyanin-like domain-containing protein n=1 Tax=Botrytis deweyae TaxID=2478750 RepID=A0ABQ7IGF5_9HELO|nr:uncharacterized protein EAE98_007501 [Botrytis deweyae]KAF7923683.1 hypothetical protein EAE98_007501 [Botrytis deweyae]